MSRKAPGMRKSRSSRHKQAGHRARTVCGFVKGIIRHSDLPSAFGC